MFNHVKGESCYLDIGSGRMVEIHSSEKFEAREVNLGMNYTWSVLTPL